MSSLLALRTIGKSLKCPAAHVNTSTYFKTPSVMSSFVNENSITRPASTTQFSGQPPLPQPPKEWRVIYHLPLMRMASAFNRVKVPFGMFNAVTIPGAFALEQASQLPPTTAALVGAFGVSSWLTLSICSLFTKNLVGIVYIKDTNDKLKLAYVDYWGKRHDVIIDLEDLVTNFKKEKSYQSLTLHINKKVNFKLLQKFGVIVDPEIFASIFAK